MEELLPFNDLVEAVKEELYRVKYKKPRINFFASVWATLGQYMEERNLNYFDMKIGLNFLDDKYNITVFTHLKYPESLRVRAVNMLGEYQLHGIVLSKNGSLVKNIILP
jgi:hypothetical protein